MDPILQQLYTGDLCPAENRHYDDPDYQSMCDASLREIEAFTAELSQEAKEKFDRLMENYLELTFAEKTQAFCDGFRIGGRVMYQIFSNGENYVR